jgi:hypothetical protein
LPLIGAILGHKNVVTTSRYAHLSNDPVADAANRAAAGIAAALGGQLGAEVLPIRKGGV